MVLFAFAGNTRMFDSEIHYNNIIDIKHLTCLTSLLSCPSLVLFAFLSSEQLDYRLIRRARLVLTVQPRISAVIAY